MVWSGVVWYGTARHGTARHCMVWYGLGYVARERLFQQESRQVHSLAYYLQIPAASCMSLAPRFNSCNPLFIRNKPDCRARCRMLILRLFSLTQPAISPPGFEGTVRWSELLWVRALERYSRGGHCCPRCFPGTSPSSGSWMPQTRSTRRFAARILSISFLKF